MTDPALLKNCAKVSHVLPVFFSDVVYSSVISLMYLTMVTLSEEDTLKFTQHNF